MRHPTAIICLTIAVLLGSAGMSWSADFQKGLTAAKSGDFATALREWKPLADQGHGRAQNGMGYIYFNGKGVPRNYKTAVKWFKLSAKNGDMRGQNSLGYAYHKGNGVPQDYNTALKWYRLAAKQGDARAQKHLIEIKKLIKVEEKEKADQVKRQVKIKKLIKVEEKEKADEIVVNKKGEPILLKSDGTWKVMSTKGEDGKVVFSIRKGADYTFSVARKNDMDEFSHYDNYAGCAYTIEVKNKTAHKIKIINFDIATNNSKLIPYRMDRNAMLQFGKVIKPGNSFIGKGSYAIGKISTKAGKTKQTPKDDQIKLWKSQYGCEAQSGSMFIKPSNIGKIIAFSKKSGVSDDAKSSFLIGSSKGMYPLMKEVKSQ